MGAVTCASSFFVVTYFLSLNSNLEATCMEKGGEQLIGSCFAAMMIPAVQVNSA